MTEQVLQIAAVYVWGNQMVMVFDTAGQQVPEYQGLLEDVGEKLAAVYPRERWVHAAWNFALREREPCGRCGGRCS